MAFFSRNMKKSCTLLLLSNMMSPEWITVTCIEPHLPYVVCEKSKLDASKLEIGLTTSLVCWPSAVKNQSTCFVFLWFSMKPRFPKTHSRCSCKDVGIDVMQHFQFLFDAVSTQFFPLISLNGKLKLTATRYYNKYHFEHSYYDVEGYQVCNMPMTQVDVSLLQNAFKCSDGSFLSILYFCEGQHHCLESEHKKRKQCSSARTEKNGGQTASYAPNKLTCCLQNSSKSNVCLEESMKGVLRSNQLKKAEDNLLLKSDSSHRMQCSQQDRTMTWKVSDVCSYKLNEKDQIFPCIFGEHLQNCENFECNLLFKCPEFYCVPWSYVCDGKWDCPFGLDETIICQGERNCSHLFRCATTTTCIHFGNICDGHRDCKIGDDEFFCILATMHCPWSCECLGFAIKCKNRGGFVEKLPSTMIFLEFLSLQSVDDILSAFDSVKSFVLTNSQLCGICGKFKYHGHIQFVDNSHNSITGLQSECFSNLGRLMVIKLEFNFISKIGVNSFQNLSKLSLVNLSSNPLSVVETSFLSHTHEPIKMSMLGISTMCFVSNIFEGVSIRDVETDLYQICCFVITDSLCGATPPWYLSCQNIINQTVVYQGICGFLSVLLLLTNLVALSCHLFLGDKNAGGFQLMVSQTCLDVFYPVFLIAIWTLHTTGSSFVFVNQLNSAHQRLCMLSSSLLLFLFWISPAVMVLLALSWVSVVVHPFDSRFKQQKLVRRYVFTLFLIVFSIVVLLTVTSQLLKINIYGSSCVPFAYPGFDSVLLKVLSFVSLIYHLISINLVIVMHIAMATELIKSDKNKALQTDKKKMTKCLSCQLILTPVVGTISWIPADIFFIVIQFVSPYPTVLIYWVSVVLMPVISAVNPLFVLVKHCRKYCS